MALNQDKATTDKPEAETINPHPSHQGDAPDSSAEADQEDLDGFEVPPGYGEDDAPRPGAQTVLISQDEFFQMFCALVSAPNAAVRPPLESLVIVPGDAGARTASDALYETCCDVHWLRFLVEPKSKWARRMLPVAVWAGALNQAIRGELAERRAYDIDPEPAAPTPGASGFEDTGPIILQTGQPAVADVAEAA